MSPNDLSKKKYRENNRDKINAKARAKYADNADKIREEKSKWRASNQSKVKEYNKRYNDNSRERSYNYTKKYREDHPGFSAKHCAKRRAIKKQSIFVGIDQEYYDFFMEEIYSLAYERTVSTGIDHSVDHIVPLNNPTVCGLHTPDNLQILTASDNSKKGNSFEANS